MRHIYAIVICLFAAQGIDVRSQHDAGTEKLRLLFLSNHESPRRRQLYLLEGNRPGELTKVNAPLPGGCPGKPWYERLILFLVSASHADSPDPSAGCFRGISDFWVTPDGRYVLYTAPTSRLGFTDLHLVDTDNPGYSFIVNKPQREHHSPHVAAISPDSLSFIYVGKPAIERRSLYLVDINNPSRQRRLAFSAEAGDDIYSAIYNHDGSKIAYCQGDRGTRTGRIFLAETARPDRQPIVIAGGISLRRGHYDFTAHGRYVIYNRVFEPGVGESSIVLVDVTDSSRRIVIDHRVNASIESFSLSPNRRILVYGAAGIDARREEFSRHIVDLATLGIPYYSESERAQLPQVVPEYAFPFAPDSQRFITRYQDQDGNKQLLEHSVSTPYKWAAVSPKAPDYGSNPVIYTPDGRKIIYAANLEGQGSRGGLYLSQLDQPINARRLSVIAEQRIHSFTLSSKGRFIAYVAEQRHQGRELYVIDLLGNTEVVTTADFFLSSPRYNVAAGHVEFLPPSQYRAAASTWR